MDDTICNFFNGVLNYKRKYPTILYPQSIPGFFINLEPIEGAIDSVNLLTEKYDVYILTRPSVKNPLCYTEKRMWIEKHFGLEFCSKLIICPNKALLKGDYLIDDFIWAGFEGYQIVYKSSEFPNWLKVMEYFEKLN